MTATARSTHGLAWALLVLLAALMVLAHGCHAGDHDDELFRPPSVFGEPR